MTKRGWFDRNKHLYPADWKAIADATKAAAGYKCEACEVPHGPPPHVLTVHHLDHAPGNCAPSNLLACCQTCHLRLGPRVYTKAAAIAKLRTRLEAERSQLSMLEVDDGR